MDHVLCKCKIHVKKQTVVVRVNAEFVHVCHAGVVVLF